MPSKSLTFSLNPSWPHYVACTATVLGVLVGLLRFTLLDPMDPNHCGALMSRGSWLDHGHQNWQPDGCMLHLYQEKDASTCLSSRDVVFIGDSVTRKLFFQLAHVIDPTLPTAPLDDEHKHSDHTLHAKSAAQLSFYWDPFLNTSRVHGFIDSPNGTITKMNSSRRPALLVLGSGLWYLRHSESGGLPAWEAKMKVTMGNINRSLSKPADDIVLLPIEDVVPSKLSPERAAAMRSSDIDAMNADLVHRINPPFAGYVHLFSKSPPSAPVSFPLVFNSMLDPSQTEDGLHFSDAIVRAQANILLNLHCNNVLPKVFPFDKTCCRQYPGASALHLIVLGMTIIWGPSMLFLSHHKGRNWSASLAKDEHVAALVFSAAVALIYTADRTGFWLKEQKQFNPWTFASLCLTFLGIGLSTMKRTDKDLGFLNRDQTDEWKGWMQIAILIYHYLGASKISGIYNPIRVLVAAYLFMAGYGHTTFYIKKADFGFLRVAQVMVRLNLFTLLLAYTMNTDYISYYFAPLVSMWYLITYGTMVAGSRFNDRFTFVVSKIIISAGLMTWFMSEPQLLESIFAFLSRVCGIHWSAREWAFRVNLDLWVVYFGMFTAVSVIKLQEHRLTDHPYWPSTVKAAICASGVVMLWYFGFELFQENKFTYNTWHPYVSILPIASFVVLRNANITLRSASSRAFSFIGTCSLETFIIQYHFWLAGDTKGLLIVIPGTQWRPVNFVITTIMFIYLSHRVAQATGEMTTWICGGRQQKTLPTTASQSLSSSSNLRLRSEGGGPESIPLASRMDADSHIRKDNDGELPREPDTPIRPSRHWVDRLTDVSVQGNQSRTLAFKFWRGEEWNPGLGMKIGVGMGVMWLVNIMWRYP